MATISDFLNGNNTTQTTQTPSQTPSSGYTQDQFLNSDIWRQYLNAHPNLKKGNGVDVAHEGQRAYQDYVNSGSTWKATVPGAQSPADATQIVPDKTTSSGQMNVADYAGQVALNPTQALTSDEKLANHVPQMTGNEAGTSINTDTTNNPSQFNAQTQTGTAQTMSGVDAKQSATYDVAKTQDKVAAADMQAAQGQVDPRANVTAQQLDMQGMATGKNADGSTNYTGQALNQYATQGMQVIDTSTEAGKIAAKAAGDGNYVDSKATIEGQLQQLQAQFTDAQGNPTIPPWAAGTARDVSRIAAFKGMTGTAATAALSQAIMEASLPIAQQDAQFFQTLTIQNLNNKQAATINKANVLANMDMKNLDNRMTAAVQNSQNFMQMDMQNLSNDQQARLINTQDRVQSILTDANQENVRNQFVAQSQNQMDEFYDNLNSSIQQFNTSQLNGMTQFNAGQENANAQFNANLENNRQEFYKNMQYQIDVANAAWRQTVTMTNNANNFQAAATDVKNLVGMSVEQLNQLWDRSDSMLQMAWQSSENDKTRAVQLATARTQANAQENAGLGAAIGSVVGKIAGSDAFTNWLFG